MSDRGAQAKDKKSSLCHFAIDLAHDAHKALDDTGHVVKQVTNSAAIRAFRQTAKSESGHILIPAMNKAGNLRGIVVSKRARVIYKISSDIAEKFAKYDSFLATAGIIIDLAKEADHIQVIRSSKIAEPEKWRMYTLIASTAILKSVTSVVPAGADIIAKSLDGYCDLAELSGFQSAATWKANLAATAVEINTAHANIFTPKFMESLGDKAFDLIEAHVHFKN